MVALATMLAIVPACLIGLCVYGIGVLLHWCVPVLKQTRWFVRTR
jgi:hypothetical protein